jgi:octaprenyl-diphosphate synthase
MKPNLKQDASAMEGILSPFAFLKPELERVEELIRAQAKAFDPAVEPYISHICNTSGKRIRPVLSFLAGGATGGITRKHDKLAVILELIHIATLVHDDIIDGADLRRQAPTANAKWGNALSVLLGDSLFSYALMLSTEFEDSHTARRIAESANAVCTGEIKQTQRRFDLSLSKKEYFDIIEKKTAELFEVAMELGGHLNGTSPAVCEAMGQFGKKIGTAYQIYDDCIDLVGDEKEFGKTLRTDLNKGKLTLPILNLLESSTDKQRERLSRLLLQKEPIDVSALANIADYVGSIEAAINTGLNLVEEARASLIVLENSEYQTALISMADFLRNLLNSCRL